MLWAKGAAGRRDEEQRALAYGYQYINVDDLLPNDGSTRAWRPWATTSTPRVECPELSGQSIH
jgi:hypothetical protein